MIRLNWNLRRRMKTLPAMVLSYSLNQDYSMEFSDASKEVLWPFLQEWVYSDLCSMIRGLVLIY